MSDKPVSLVPAPEGYANWLGELKNRIHSAQQRAALAVNRELVLLYWQIGRDILQRQAEQGWGAKAVSYTHLDVYKRQAEQGVLKDTGTQVRMSGSGACLYAEFSELSEAVLAKTEITATMRGAVEANCKLNSTTQPRFRLVQACPVLTDHPLRNWIAR